MERTEIERAETRTRGLDNVQKAQRRGREVALCEKNGSWSNWKDGKQVSQTQQRFHGAIAGDNRHTEADLSFLNATTVGEAKDGILR